MKRKYHFRSILAAFNTLPSITFISILIISLVAACNIPSNKPSNIPQSAQAFSDKNARMYQMYYDSSADPAQNELQVRRFLGQLHLADLEDIFGDIQSLPQDEDCNYVGGPVVRDDVIWYVTVTPDLVGVNLISIAFDGTRSSAFDLDGDRIIDILDIRLSDFRRFSFVTEKLGMDVFKYFVQGRNPFCDSELIRRLHLPELGCNDTGEGTSGGGNNSNPGYFPGTDIVDPIEMICSEYDTSPEANIVAHNPNQGLTFYITRPTTHEPGLLGSRSVQTWDSYDLDTGEFVGTQKIIIEVQINAEGVPEVVTIVDERVNANGLGSRVIILINPTNGQVINKIEQSFEVADADSGRPNYDHTRTNPPDPTAPDPEASDGNDHNDGNNPSDNPAPQGGGSPNEGNPGREGDDSIIAEFCRNRANHQSGIEQALEEDPTSMGVSCGDLVDAPSNPNCMVIEWATELDFMSVFEMAGDDGNCDPNGERGCEPAGVDEQISRFRGMTAELWSLDLPSINFCPAVVCDPALESAMQTYSYTAGEVEFSCAEIPEEPTLEPSEENCPPGTYYALVTDRCIEIQIPQAGGNGGNGGSSGACNLSTSACTSQGLSFDSVNCACVPIQ